MAAGTAHLSLGGFVAAGLVDHRHVGPVDGHGGVPLAPHGKLLQHGQELGGGFGGRVPLAGATRAVVVDADQQAGLDHGVESAAEHGFGDAEALASRSPEHIRARRQPRLHPGWWVAAVAFLALLGAAGFRGAPGALMVPLHHEFGWSITVMSLAVGINLLLYGLVAPFAAALMDRFGMRQVISTALFHSSTA